MNDKFVVKDTGNREEFDSGMHRNSAVGKIRYDLVIPKKMQRPMLKRWAEHMTKGAAIYGDRNWERATSEKERERFRESAFRHFMQWYMGEKDEDHAAATFFNIQGAEYVEERMENKECQHILTSFDYICTNCMQLVPHISDFTPEELKRAQEIKARWSQ